MNTPTLPRAQSETVNSVAPCCYPPGRSHAPRRADSGFTQIYVGDLRPFGATIARLAATCYLGSAASLVTAVYWFTVPAPLGCMNKRSYILRSTSIVRSFHLENWASSVEALGKSHLERRRVGAPVPAHRKTSA